MCDYPLNHIKKILVIRLGAIGDFVLTLPTIYALRSQFPEVHLEILGYVSVAVLALGERYANTITSFDQSGISSLFVNRDSGSEGPEPPQSLLTYLSSFDTILLFLHARWGVFPQNLKKICGPKLITYSSFPTYGEHVHMVDHLLRSLETLNIRNPDRVPKIAFTETERDFAQQFINKLNMGKGSGRRKVAIHPGSGSKKKCWQVEKFAEIIYWLRRREAVKILIISGPADEENVSRLSQMVGNFKIVQERSIKKVAAVLQRCDLFIGNDSGITHISAAVQIPTVAIFGPTDPQMWGMRGEAVRIVKSSVSCAPCSTKERELCRRQRCLEEVSVRDVFSAVNSLLQPSPQP